MRTGSDDQNGQVLVMFALVLVGLMAFASLAIDLGMLRNDRQTLANAVDAAALAGGTKMPIDGSKPGQVAAVDTLITKMMQANYPGLSSSAWQVTYKCLIGVDGSSPPQPWISRDVPATCDPSFSLGRAPVASDFQGAGTTRFSSCDPSVGDKCNVVVVDASATQNFTFGRVVGVDSGSTGLVSAAACNGPCGNPPNTPVDLVVIIDRTASMSNADVQATRDAAKAVLQIYDPTVQHVALGLLGPSVPSSSCGSPAVSVNTGGSTTYGTNPASDLAKWIPIGLTGAGVAAPGYNEMYSDGAGNLNANSHIVAAINCFDHPGGTGTNLTTPMAMATYYLQHYGRPGVKWGIILETDGQPNYSNTLDPANYTCASADAAATAAKNAGIEVFTVGFGLDGTNDVNCPDASGTWNGKKVTTLLASMASQPSTDNLCTSAENVDADHFYCEPKTSDLTTVFSTAAAQFAGIRTHLVRLYPVPLVTGLSPSAGTHLGGTTVTVSGKYFTGVTRVTFGNASMPFTFISDSQLVVTAPAGSVGSSLDVIVTTPGGSSPVMAGDVYTFN